jgi:voltage-dependent calcium channel T type alpha-1H
MFACCGRWVNPAFNFDNVINAIVTLFSISTTELWVNTMYSGVAAVGVDQQPVDAHNPAISLFFVVFMVFGGFFVLQLFVSVTIEKVSLPHQRCKTVLPVGALSCSSHVYDT